MNYIENLRALLSEIDEKKLEPLNRPVRDFILTLKQKLQDE